MIASTPAPRRILFVDHTARMGGGEIALLNLIDAIDRTRFEPAVLLFSAGPLADKLRAAGVETRVLPLADDVADARKDALGGGGGGGGLAAKLWTALRAAAFVWRVRGAIRSARPAIVHCNSLKSDLLAGLAGRLAGVPVIWHVRDRIADDYLPRRVASLFRWLARRVPTFVIANSRSTLDALGRRPGDAPSAVVHDGVPPGIVASDVAARDDASRRLRVGLVGRLARWKGQHVFLDAIARLGDRFPGVEYQIIGSALFGEDDYERELRDTVARGRLGGRVEFTGFRADVGAAIADLDVLVHASITGEPFGQVVVEGMAAGKPVVATAGGGVVEIVVDGETGLLVPMNDAPAMAEAIARLLGDADLRRRMGSLGRRRVLERFVITLTAARVEAIYERVLSRRAKSAASDERIASGGPVSPRESNP